MQYKAIVLELLQEQYPAMHEQLRASRMLLQAVGDYAAALKRHHESWIERLSIKRPDSDPMQTASQALELAILDLQSDLPSESAAGEASPLALDAAMAYITSNRMPPA